MSLYHFALTIFYLKVSWINWF